MECGGETKFLLTATYRKTWNCLKLHIILVQNKNQKKKKKTVEE